MFYCKVFKPVMMCTLVANQPINYRPGRKGRLCFQKLLPVILSTGEESWATPPLTQNPLMETPQGRPLLGRLPLDAENPWRQTPFLDADLPGSDIKWRPLQRLVRILMECIFICQFFQNLLEIVKKNGQRLGEGVPYALLNPPMQWGKAILLRRLCVQHDEHYNWKIIFSSGRKLRYSKMCSLWKLRW